MVLNGWVTVTDERFRGLEGTMLVPAIKVVVKKAALKLRPKCWPLAHTNILR